MPYNRLKSSDHSSLLSSARKVKKGEYTDLFDDIEMYFHPLAFDIYGSAGLSAVGGLHCFLIYVISKRDQPSRGTPTFSPYSELLFNSELRLLSIVESTTSRSSDSPTLVFK